MTTLERLCAVIERVFEDEVNLEGVTPESDLRADVGLNSIGMLYLAMELENEFGVSFDNSDFGKLQKVSDVIDKVEGQA